MKLSAAIIAGGHSHRMGRDKALLPDPTHGTLLQRQLALLATLEPAELLVSCRPDQVLPLPDTVRRIHDPGTDGPLGGLAALLGALRGDMLLVLAVDLGDMTAPFLRRMIAARDVPGGRGLVPRVAGEPEPLVALYPASLGHDAARRLASGHDLSLRGLVHAGIEAGHLRWFDVAPGDAPCFANWNTPVDLHARPPA